MSTTDNETAEQTLERYTLDLVELNNNYRWSTRAMVVQHTLPRRLAKMARAAEHVEDVALLRCAVLELARALAANRGNP